MLAVLALFTTADSATVISAIIGGTIALTVGFVTIGLPLWLGRRDMRQARGAAEHVAKQMEPDGGLTIRDKVDKLIDGQQRQDERQMEITKDLAQARTDLTAWAGDISQRVGSLETRVQGIDERLTRVEHLG